MKRLPPRGFTLVEVLVALFIMAIMAALAWRGIDGMARARTIGQQRMEQSLRLDTVLTQWEQDLAAMYDTRGTAPPWTFTGATLILTRRTDAGVQVVAWSLRNGQWLRWAAPSTTLVSEVQNQWLRAQQLLGNEPQQTKMAQGVASWQLYCYRGGWSNCQSTGDVENPTQQPQPQRPQQQPQPQQQQGQPQQQQGQPQPQQGQQQQQRQTLPTGIRLQIAFDGSGLQGTLTRDVMLSSQSPP